MAQTKSNVIDFNINLYTDKGVLSLPLKFYPHKSSNCDVEEARDHVKKDLSELLNDTSHVWVETNEEM